MVAYGRASVYQGRRPCTVSGESPVPLLHLVVLALVQGITEFLPISSSAHLVLVPALTGWDDQGLIIDVAVHVGTLAAVMVYFRRDIAGMVVGFLKLLVGRWTPGGRLALLVAWATIPVVVAGAALHAALPQGIRSVELIAWATILYAIVLYAADRLSLQIRKVEHVGWVAALFVGLAQALALIPGTSRSGITMTAGRLIGMERTEAARLSLLMSIPTILGAGMLTGLDLADAGDAALTGDAILAAALAFVAALVAIWALMRWLKVAGFGPFVVYRLLLGVGLLWWLHG